MVYGVWFIVYRSWFIVYDRGEGYNLEKVAAPQSTQDQTRRNGQRQYLGYQGEYTPKVEIPGRRVSERYSTSWIAFYNCSAYNVSWRDEGYELE
jgi:hypothetical protein